MQNATNASKCKVQQMHQNAKCNNKCIKMQNATNASECKMQQMHQNVNANTTMLQNAKCKCNKCFKMKNPTNASKCKMQKASKYKMQMQQMLQSAKCKCNKCFKMQNATKKVPLVNGMYQKYQNPHKSHVLHICGLRAPSWLGFYADIQIILRQCSSIVFVFQKCLLLETISANAKQ